MSSCEGCINISVEAYIHIDCGWCKQFHCLARGLKHTFFSACLGEVLEEWGLWWGCGWGRICFSVQRLRARTHLLYTTKHGDLKNRQRDGSDPTPVFAVHEMKIGPRAVNVKKTLKAICHA